MNLHEITSYAKAESLIPKNNVELARQQRAFLRNSDRSFTWGQVAKYSGMVFGAVVGGLSFAFANALLNPAAAGAEMSAIQSFVAATGPGLMVAAVAVSAIVSLAATYISYRISAENHINANEINAQSTGREIAEKLREQPLEVKVAPDVPTRYTDFKNSPERASPNTQIATSHNELLDCISSEVETLSSQR
jgi:hypothetical protein